MNIKKIEKILLIILILVLVSLLTVYIYCIKSSKFHKPKFDENTKVGMPKINENLGYKDFKINDGYLVYLCGKVKLVDNAIQVFLTSDKTNNIYIKARVYKGKKIVGETGLIKPGEYIKNIKIKNVEKNDDISIKIMGYDPKKYTSEGAFTINTKVW